MQLTVRDVARFLNVPEETVHLMIQRSEIPTHRIENHFFFDRDKIIEWAKAKRLAVSPELLRAESDCPPALPSLTEALRLGGIFYGLNSGDKATALRSMVDVLRLPPYVDRDLLFRMYVAREAMMSTSIGEGIAIPHTRSPVVLQVPAPHITLCFLKTPVDFGAADGKPVSIFFSLIAPSTEAHLCLLSRLACVLRNRDLLDLLHRQAPVDEIMAAITHADTDPAQC